MSSGEMLVHGGLDIEYAGDQKSPTKILTDSAHFEIKDDQAVVTLTDPGLMIGEHVYGILLVDGVSGKPISENYAKHTRVISDQSGIVEKIKLQLTSDHNYKNVRIHFMVDMHSVASSTLTR